MLPGPHNNPLMEALADYLKQATKDAQIKNYPRGQILLYKNDKPVDIMVVRKGIVKIFDTDENDNEKILHLIKPLGVIPLAFFSGGKEKIHWCYSALTECEVSVIPYEDFYKLLDDNCDFALQLMNWFSVEVHELLVRLSSLGKTNAEDKIKAALKFLAVNHSKKKKDSWVQVDFSVN